MMKFLVLFVVVLVALAQARDLSQYSPKSLSVWPKRLPYLTHPRIANGDEAERHQFPHQVALFTDENIFCGGSILDANVILTDAHCVDGARSIDVVAGAHSFQESEESQQAITSSNFIFHDDWEPYKYENDVALIVLPEPLKFDGKTVVPIELYTGDSTLEDADATVSGWGSSSSWGALNPVLRYTSNPIISNYVCGSYYGIIKSSHICLSGRGGRSACDGDIGGPLTINEDGKIKLVGVSSFTGLISCGTGYPSGYSRVSSFADWINEKRAALEL